MEKIYFGEFNRQYDNNGNLIYFKYKDFVDEVNKDDYEIIEVWKDYDENGNCIKIEESSGFTCIMKYDDRNNLICKDTGLIETYEYDENNNLIHFKNSAGYQSWNSYNEKGEVTYFRDNVGRQRWKDYDENGNCIFERVNNEVAIWHECRTFNDKNEIIYSSAVDIRKE